METPATWTWLPQTQPEGHMMGAPASLPAADSWLAVGWAGERSRTGWEAQEGGLCSLPGSPYLPSWQTQAGGRAGEQSCAGSAL